MLSNVSISEVPTKFVVQKTGGQQFDGSEFRFDPAIDFPMALMQFALKAGNEAKDYQLSLHMADVDEDVLMSAGSTETDVIITPTTGILLGPRDWMKFTTTTATAAMTVAMWFKLSTGLRSGA